MAVRLLVFLTLSLTFINAGAFRDYYREAVGEDISLPKRGPAAIEPQKIQTVQNYKDTMIEINCGRKLAQEMRINSPWAQIKGRYCKPSKGKVVEIRNESNGFTASLFELGENQYKTDLIQLNAGQNEIRIRSQNAKGEFEEQTFFISSSSI